MKKQGSTSEFGAQRQRALMDAYRNEIGTCSRIRVHEIARKVVKLPCERFWVSEERAAIVVSAMQRGVDSLAAMRPTKRRMFVEIHRRVEQLRGHRPRATLMELVAEVVNSPAPEFYMTPRYARDIINDCIGDRWV